MTRQWASGFQIVRVTPLDRDLRPVAGGLTSRASAGTVDFTWLPVIEDAEDAAPIFDHFDVRISMREVEYAVLRAAELALDAGGGIAVEAWKPLAGGAPEAPYGYLLAPALRGVVVAVRDWTLPGRVDFTLDVRTQLGSRWDAGPHADSALDEPMLGTEHLHVQVTRGAPKT